MESRTHPPPGASVCQRPLRVLHIINGLGPGGAETVLFRLATHPSQVDHEVVCLEGRDWYSEKLEEAGVKVRHLEWTSVASTAPLKLYRLIKNSEADVVQAWMYRSNLVAGILGRMAGKPVVWNIRCSSLEPLRLGSKVLAYVGGFVTRWACDFVINCSARSEELHRKWGYGAVAGAVIPNGYDPALLYPDEQARAAMREQLGISSDQFVIGTVSRWHPMKGFPLLLRALNLVADRGVPTRLLLVGRDLDPANEELATLIDESHCKGQVALMGERPDIPDIARAFDVHVLASIGAEGFPNVIAETMLAGTPNVATDVGDAAVIVGDTGWVVSPRDAEQLAGAIEQAHHEWESIPENWRIRRIEARQRIAERFSLERMAQAYEAVWRRVARSKRSQSDLNPSAVQ